MGIGVWGKSLQLPYANSRKRPPPVSDRLREVGLYIYNPPIYFCGISLDKTDNETKKTGRWLSEDIRRSI